MRGSWDLWAQTLIHMATLGGALLWFSFKILTGTFPVHDHAYRKKLWSLAALAAASIYFSPLYGVSAVHGLNVFNGLFLLWALPLMRQEQRRQIDKALHMMVWILLVLSVQQRWEAPAQAYEHFPPSTLVTANAYAGFLVMAVPLSYLWNDVVLLAGLLAALWWTGSVGAWLSLSCALILYFLFRRKKILFWVGLSVGALCLLSALDKLAGDSLAHRWHWWLAAGRMSLTRPLLGFGPGTFAYLLPAFKVLSPEKGMGSLYAHQAVLEWAAEWGLPATALWLTFIASAVRNLNKARKVALLAAVIHSLGDFTLSIPSNFWLFCYLVAYTQPESSEHLNIPGPRKPWLLAGALCAAVFMGGFIVAPWRAQRKLMKAREIYSDTRDLPRALSLLQEAARLAPRQPDAYLLMAQLTPDFQRKLDWQERGARLNPYRPKSWKDLADLQKHLGQAEQARETLRQARRYIPWLTE
ncbi:MAG: hypothetical protein HY611_01640 [Elusimicrobia bacterium]|nr:hypothetical protein [Elusimicrobiota bacterium]